MNSKGRQSEDAKIVCEACGVVVVDARDGFRKEMGNVAVDMTSLSFFAIAQILLASFYYIEDFKGP